MNYRYNERMNGYWFIPYYANKKVEEAALRDMNNYAWLAEKPKLAVGASNEHISGVMPLYLFKEHWEVAKLKIEPVLGYMCTLQFDGFN